MPKKKNAKSGEAKRQNPIRGSSKATSSSSSAAAIHPTSLARGSNKATKSKRTPASSSSLTTANQQPSLDTRNPTMAPKIFCILDDDLSLFAFDYFRDEMIDTLKGRIYDIITTEPNVKAKDLTLWKANIPIVEGANYKKVVDDTKKDRNNKMGPADLVKEHIPEVLSKIIQIVVEVPQQGQKRVRDRSDAEEHDSKRTKLKISPLRRAIEAEGLIQRADRNGSLALSRLDPKERISVLQHLGEEVYGDNPYRSIVEAATFFQYSSFKDLDLISAPSDDSEFPVTHMRDLENQGGKQIVVTGTSGIGKSAFLVYFAVRLLATSRDDNPPILVFQDRETSDVYVYGELSVLRSGDTEDFAPFLDLPETWFLVDSVKNPLLIEARTILAVSSKTLNSETNRPYKEVAKRVSNRYYMARGR